VVDPSRADLPSPPSLSSALSFLLVLPSARAMSKSSFKLGRGLPCFCSSLVSRLIMASSRLDMTPFLGGRPGPFRLAGISSGATPTRTEPTGSSAGTAGGVSVDPGVVPSAMRELSRSSTDGLTSAGKAGGGGMTGASGGVTGFSVGLTFSASSVSSSPSAFSTFSVLLLAVFSFSF